MDTAARKKHWDNIFTTKDTSQVSWFQQIPETTLKLIETLQLPAKTPCIDIGCGDSCLPKFLLEKGYKNLAAVDISQVAIDQSKIKMGTDSEKVNWIVSDITEFEANEKFGLWHDRAVFHFLSDAHDIKRYVEVAGKNIQKNGYLILGTFSDLGPDMCSGLFVKRYNSEEINGLFNSNFKLTQHFYDNHKTPSGSLQSFLFCVFQRK